MKIENDIDPDGSSLYSNIYVHHRSGSQYDHNIFQDVINIEYENYFLTIHTSTKQQFEILQKSIIRSNHWDCNYRFGVVKSYTHKMENNIHVYEIKMYQV